MYLVDGPGVSEMLDSPTVLLVLGDGDGSAGLKCIRKHVDEKYIPLYIFLHMETGVCRGFHFFIF